jgi:hypothetical protein
MAANSRTTDGRITLSTVVMSLIAIGCFAIAVSSPHLSAIGGPYSQPEPPTPPLPPVPQLPVSPFNPKVPVFVPTDVTNINIGAQPNLSVPALWALSGIQSIPESQFPKESELGGSAEWVLVRARPDASYTKPTSYSVNLQKGDILVTVKKPSNMAMVTTPYGKISIASDGDALITFNDGILRIQNIDGMGKSVLAQVQPEGTAKSTVQLAPGFEFVAANRKLSRIDLKPKDGIARRHFSVESAIQNSDLIADIRQNTSGVKERRILSDMSKMASVLNYMRGESGFTTDK